MGRNRHSIRAVMMGLALCLGTTGCVYWRLFQVRRQLSGFDTYFVVRHDPGPVLESFRPVLKAGDLGWLTGFAGTKVSAPGWDYALRYRFVKQGVAEMEADDHAVVEVVLRIRDGRIGEIEFPPRFNPYFTSEILRHAFDGVDQGLVDRQSGRTAWQLSDAIGIPTLEGLLALLGRPSGRTDTEMHVLLKYNYRLEGAPDDAAADVEADLLYTRENELMVKAHHVMGLLTLDMRKDPDGAYHVSLQRARKASE